jgi:restriction endonuclease S subunit
MPPPTNARALGEIAGIRAGFTFRGKIEELPTGAGNAHVAQIKDVREAWAATNSMSLIASQLPLIDWNGKSNAFVNPGAVLLPSRGSRGGYFQASCLVSDERSSLPVVASSQFLILSPEPGVLPEFLCWSLNRPSIQYWLSEGSGSQGSGIVMLTAKLVGELKLEVPSLNTQRKILHLNQLWEREQLLSQALLANRKAMLHGMFQQLLKEKNNER